MSALIDETEDEFSAYFVGPCTCDHEEEEHGWGECGVYVPTPPNGVMAPCPCEAGWWE